MNFKRISKESRDGTARYEVEPKDYNTLGEFVNIVLNERFKEWGCFKTPWGEFEYKYGKLLKPIPEEIINLPICIYFSYGGWTQMDYRIIEGEHPSVKGMRKVKFDVKYRPEIESGEIKVVDGRGKPVTILKWDMQGNYPILGIVMTNHVNYDGDESWEEERPFAYNDEGRAAGSAPSEKKELYLLVEGSDLSALEKELSGMLDYAKNHSKPDAEIIGIFKDRIYDCVKCEVMNSLPKWVKCEVYPYTPGVFRVNVGWYEYMGYQINIEDLFEKLEKVE